MTQARGCGVGVLIAGVDGRDGGAACATAVRCDCGVYKLPAQNPKTSNRHMHFPQARAFICETS